MMEKKALLFGYGNVGRQDDGLGVKLSLLFEETPLGGLNVDSNYQLNIEDALTISQYDLVIFADASIEASPPFKMEKLLPASEIQFTTHAMHPASVLALCQDLYHKLPDTYLLTIPGYNWDVGEEMSPMAEQHLQESHLFVKQFVTAYLKNFTTSSLDKQ